MLFTVEEYKDKLAERYKTDPVYIDHMVGGLEPLLHIIDNTLSEALADFKESLEGYSDSLRCPPMIFPIPRGDHTNAAEFVIILKRDEDGDTLVYSPYPLPHLGG